MSIGNIKLKNLEYLCNRLNEAFNDVWVPELGVSEGKGKKFYYEYQTFEDSKSIRVCVFYEYLGKKTTLLATQYEAPVGNKHVEDTMCARLLQRLMFTKDSEETFSDGYIHKVKSATTMFKE